MNSAALPTALEDVQGDSRWMDIHERFVKLAKTSQARVVFFGDSITRLMEDTDAWDKFFRPLGSENFGVGGDATHHLLWRIQNGELDGIDPKVVVLLIGTNNHEHTAEQIVEAIRVTVQYIVQKKPEAKILLLGVLPRGFKPNRLRDKIRDINGSLAEFPKEFSCLTYLDVGHLFLREDGTIHHEDMFDYLHLTRKGYNKMCTSMEKEIVKLLE
eukprot:m.28849 g.28849  ORF g.28849 m.28849 type:complete len:214 (+) comp31073_c0_seq3:182-823(+)